MNPLLTEIDWLRQQLAIRDAQLMAAWQELFRLRLKCADLELRTHTWEAIYTGGQEGDVGQAGCDTLPQPEVVYIQLLA